MLLMLIYMESFIYQDADFATHVRGISVVTNTDWQLSALSLTNQHWKEIQTLPMHWVNLHREIQIGWLCSCLLMYHINMHRLHQPHF